MCESSSAMIQATGDADPWNRYWDYGNLHSFSQVTPGQYGGVIATFWDQQFQRLRAGDRVVDIATGNGAIALMALEAAQRMGRSVQIHGTDRAAIDPAHSLADPTLRERASAIRFHGHTPAEALPFEAASINLACSQFGLEYSDLERSIPELARVLAAGGHAALMLHHADSAAVEAAGREARQLDFVLDDVRLYAHARLFLHALTEVDPATRGRRKKLPAKAAKKRQALDRSIERIQAAAAQAEDDRLLLGPLNYVHEVLAMTERVGPSQALDWLEEARRRVSAMRARLAAMQAAALDEPAMTRCARALEQAGFATPAIEVVCEAQERILGWSVVAQRP